MSACTLAFTLQNDFAQFAPRLGTLSLQRLDGTSTPEIQTPGFITASSRGVVPHLSRDHVKMTNAIRLTNIPFESFLERTPPVPTLQPGLKPLHAFLGFPTWQHILSLSLRDPFDGREMPANNKLYVSANCIRGVRKVTPADWRNYAIACKPDLVVALSDVPYTNQLHSQKRTTKGIERSTGWLADFLRPVAASLTGEEEEAKPHHLNVLVNLVGGTDARARTLFSQGLIETLHGREQEQVQPIHTLDEGVSGYIFDFLPLRLSLDTKSMTEPKQAIETDMFAELARASLAPLPQNKVRIAYSTTSPHEILRFVQDVGVDLFDSHWAQRAANIGIALDFRFPAIPDDMPIWNDEHCPCPQLRSNGKWDLGHNLFSEKYAHQHTRLASSFLNGTSPETQTEDSHVCPCGACSPSSLSIYLTHSSADARYLETEVPQRPYTRSYLHHLLHTHEMSSHTLLVMHNLSVMDAFFAGIRQVLKSSPASFLRELDRFAQTYDESTELFDEAEKLWAKIESQRGKGRLAREKQSSGQVTTE